MTTFGETVLVTGAAGFIGSHLVDRLLADGYAVIGVDNFDPFYAADEKRRNLVGALSSKRFTFHDADCRDLTHLEKTLGGRSIDAIVHLAARAGVRPSIEDPVLYASLNVVGTQVMLELARRFGIRRFIFGSSSSVYGDTTPVPFREDAVLDQPISPYAATKRAGELLCHSFHHLFHMHIVALRFFTVYGPRQRPDLAIRKFATMMLGGEDVPMFGDGTSGRDYTWIDDIVEGILAALQRSTQEAAFHTINLGGDRTVSLSDLIRAIADALGIEPRIRRFPAQPGDVHVTAADLSKARALLGYEPTTTLQSGLDRFVEWLRVVS